MSNLIGFRFGKLLVISKGDITKSGYQRWLCQCDCGNTKAILRSSLISNHTKSCGCNRKSSCKVNFTKHGKHGTPEYISWQKMKNRCLNPNCKEFKYWGGKGVSICERWMNSFDNFLHDMGYKPTLKHTLDRFPDKNGNYEIGNCRWADKKEQSCNRKDNLWFEYKGNSMMLSDWAILLKVNYNAIYSQVKKKKFHDVYEFYKSKITQ